MKPQSIFTAMMTSALLVSTALAELKPPAEYDLKAIDKYLADYVKTKNLPGMSVAIVKDGKLVHAKAFGKRSLEDNSPLQTDTPMAIGSVSKQFTCAAILLLAEEGKLSVHDKVSKYYPKLTRANDITLLELMNNVSGYPDFYPLDFVDTRMKSTIPLDDLIQRYAGAKLDFEPGSRYSYSNTGFVLLGRVVEKVSGQPFGEFLTQRILKPLGMNLTSHEPDISPKQFARGYTTFALSGPEYVKPEAKGWIGAAGAMYSTPSDLAKWNIALMNGKVLKPESLALMTKARTLNDGKLTEYGCGLGVKMQNSRQIWAHGGAVAGFVTSSQMIPSTKSSVILMANQDGGNGSVPAQLMALLLKEPVPNVPKIKGLTAAEAAKKAFADLQGGKANRKSYSEEFNLYLTDEKIASASGRLKEFGAVKNVEVLSSNERGGMEVTTSRLTFKKGTLRTLMYRMPDGKVEQFFVYPD